VFEGRASVGGRPEVLFHACDESADLLHQWFIETLADPNAPAPSFVA
jgi:hypothetical protein